MRLAGGSVLLPCDAVEVVVGRVAGGFRLTQGPGLPAGQGFSEFQRLQALKFLRPANPDLQRAEFAKQFTRYVWPTLARDNAGGLLLAWRDGHAYWDRDRLKT